MFVTLPKFRHLLPVMFIPISYNEIELACGCMPTCVSPWLHNILHLQRITSGKNANIYRMVHTIMTNYIIIRKSGNGYELWHPIRTPMICIFLMLPENNLINAKDANFLYHVGMRLGISDSIPDGTIISGSQIITFLVKIRISDDVITKLLTSWKIMIA